jgi:hypothetical protein
MIAGRLRGGVGAAGRIGRRFGKRRIVRRQRTKNLVGGNVEKSEFIFLLPVELRPVLTATFEQPKRPDHVGLGKGLRRIDRPVDMGLGSEMHDRLDSIFAQQFADELVIGDGAPHENMPGFGFKAGQVLGIPRVGQRVEIDDQLDRFGRTQKIMDEVGADKPGPAGDHDSHGDFSQTHRRRESAIASRTGRRGKPIFSALVVSSTQLERRAMAARFMNSSSEAK